MNISLDYTLTIEEWAEAFHARNRFKRLRLTPIVVLIIITSLLMAFLPLFAMKYGARLFFALFFILDAAFLIAMFGLFVIQRRITDLAQVEWKSNPSLRGRCMVRLDESAMRIVQECREATWQWSAFVKFDETGNLMLLYISDRSFHPIPKRAFSAGDVPAFKDFLIKTLPPARASKSGFEVITKPPPPRPVYVQPLESRDFM